MPDFIAISHVHKRTSGLATSTPGPTPGEVAVRVDGVDYGPFALTGLPRLEFVDCGGFFGSSPSDADFDEFNVGSTLGGTDLFAADMSSGPIPPFTTTYGSVIVAGGALNCTALASTFTAAEYDFGSEVASDYYIHLVVRFDASMVDANEHGTFATAFSLTDFFGIGFYASGLDTGTVTVFTNTDDTTFTLPAGIVADQWYTVDIHVNAP